MPSSNPNSQNVAEEVSSLLRRDDLHLAKDEQDKFEVVDPEHVNTQTGTGNVLALNPTTFIK